MAYDRDADRVALLEATLPHTPFDGWSQRALEAGARDAALDPSRMLNAFPGGMAELLDFYHRVADARMLARLAEPDVPSMRVREKIALALRTRLEQNIAQREAVRAACTFLAMPQNLALGVRCLYRTVDTIWYAAGDRSTDYNFYSKRCLLAGVYGATVLYWLNDKSESQSASWEFLGRRISEVMSLPKALTEIGQVLDRLPNPIRIMRRMRGRSRSGAPRS